MQQNKYYSNRKHITFLILLTVLMLTGNIISIERFRVFGLVLSAYRVVIPCITLYYMCWRIRQNNIKEIINNYVLIIYVGMIIFWILWGIGLMVISPYVDLREAIKDFLSLFLGMLSIYCFFELCDSQNALETVFKYIRIICSILCIWALVEIFTGAYLPFSKYYWIKLIDKKDTGLVLLQGLKDAYIYPTTTIFFNINDFSAFLAIFLPLFYPNRNFRKKDNIIRGLWMIIIIFILSVNDSNIAIIATLISSIVYFICVAGKRKYAGMMTGLMLFFYTIGNKLVFSALVYIKSCLPIKVPEAAKKYGDIMELIRRSQLFNVTEVMEIQVMDAAGGSANSLACRWQITLSSLRMTLHSKFMGIGPAAFRKYIEKYEEDSKLVDPHNWWLEILSQYGIFIFFAYLIAMLMIFVKVCKLYEIHKEASMLVYICMCITFCLACIAPSNYLSYSYQWILPAIGIVFIHIKGVTTSSAS